MIRMGRLTDYGIVLLARMTAQPGAVHTAHGLAAASRVPLPTASKILKELARAGLVLSHRGRRGGYALARPPETISIGQIVTALEGPIALTDCTGPEDAGRCSLESFCPARDRWAVISRAVAQALDDIPLSTFRPGAPRPPVPLTTIPALAT